MTLNHGILVYESKNIFVTDDFKLIFPFFYKAKGNCFYRFHEDERFHNYYDLIPFRDESNRSNKNFGVTQFGILEKKQFFAIFQVSHVACNTKT